MCTIPADISYPYQTLFYYLRSKFKEYCLNVMSASPKLCPSTVLIFSGMVWFLNESTSAHFPFFHLISSLNWLRRIKHEIVL